MELIKGNKALAAELGVNNNTISKWLRLKWIKPKKRIGNTIYWDLEEVLSGTGMTQNEFDSIYNTFKKLEELNIVDVFMPDENLVYYSDEDLTKITVED